MSYVIREVQIKKKNCDISTYLLEISNIQSSQTPDAEGEAIGGHVHFCWEHTIIQSP